MMTKRRGMVPLLEEVDENPLVGMAFQGQSIPSSQLGELSSALLSQPLRYPDKVWGANDDAK